MDRPGRLGQELALERWQSPQQAAAPASSERPVFYFDLGSPDAYLLAERVLSELPELAEWEPVLASALPGDDGDRRSEVDDAARREVERRARERGLQPVRWPARWPPDAQQAMCAATYAKQVGRTVAFALAAFRQVFAAGRDLGDPDTLLIAGAACELHPTALLAGMRLRATHRRLEAATAAAAAAGVRRVPALRAAGCVFHGDAGLEAAAAALLAGAPAGGGS